MDVGGVSCENQQLARLTGGSLATFKKLALHSDFLNYSLTWHGMVSRLAQKLKVLEKDDDPGRAASRGTRLKVELQEYRVWRRNPKAQFAVIQTIENARRPNR